ncbi:MAG: fumarylacetoacetate hydrolase family protein [Betaproteobacteria bacterium]|nr:fumarylacetoacetate hydrolase family protein [Betaproteobacteria bacterium]
MKLASLKGPTRDGTLLLVDENLTRAVAVPDIAPTMQYALEHWHAVEPQLLNEFEAIDSGSDRPIIDFQKALAEGKIAAPLPRTHQWMDGSAYLSHVERVRRARNDKVPESFYTDPLMYQGGGDTMLGPRDDIEVLSEDWGVDFEGEVGVITGDVKMGATPAECADAIRLVVLINDVSYRKLIPAELAKGFGFVNSKGLNSLSPVAVTPDELGGAWGDEKGAGKLDYRLVCHVRGEWFGNPNAADDMTFSLLDLVSHAAKTRPLAAGTLIGSGTVSNHDKATGYACIMEKRLVEQVELGAAKEDFLRFGDEVDIDMFDHHGETIFGNIRNKLVKAGSK